MTRYEDMSSLLAFFPNYKPLTLEEQIRTFETLPRDSAEKVLVLHTLGYAYKAASTFFIPHASAEDVFQYAALALVKAAENFDPSKNIPFIALAKTAVDRKLSQLYDPKWGLKDTRMNCLTSSISSLISTNRKGDDIGYDDALSHMINTGRTIAGDSRVRKVEESYIDGTIDDILNEVRLNVDKLFTQKPKNLERDIGWFKRVSRGDVIHDFAEKEGYSVARIADAVNGIRYAIVKMALAASHDDKWGWLFAKSSTVGIARRSSLPGASRAAWQAISQARDQIDAKRKDKSESRKKWITRYDAESDRYVASMPEDLDIGDKPHIVFKGNLSKMTGGILDRSPQRDAKDEEKFCGKSPSMNYDKFLGCVRQRRYAVNISYRPKSGGSCTAEGYKSLALVETEQRQRERASSRRQPKGDFNLMA